MDAGCIDGVSEYIREGKMFKLFHCTLLVIASCSVMLSGCGVKTGEPADSGQSHFPQINCIGVLPATFLAKGQVVPVYVPEEKSSRQGVQVMNEILSEQLGGKSNIRFIGIDQLASLDLTGGENTLEIARLAGKNINCNAVLESTVKRFSQRIGGRYSVESPASVSFEMRLFSLETSSVLWSAKFDEVQKSVMENILEWNKATTRGFVWVTAEELMQEGVKRKLVGGTYFNSEGK
jgi:hypothetical protein